MSILNSVLANTIQNTIQSSAYVEPVTAPTAPKATLLASGHKLFTVEKADLSGPYGNIPDKKGIFVAHKCINIVSPSYEVHQPSEIVNKFYEVAASHGLEVNRVISNTKNGGLLLSAKYAQQNIGGEAHDVNLTFFTSHCGKYRTFLSLDTLRMACFNQVPALYRNKSRHIFAEKHYKNALSIETIGSALEYIPQSLADHNAKIEQLKEKKLSLNDFISLWQAHYKYKTDQKQFDSKVAALKATYYNATGQDVLPNDSAIKAFNAITFENTHSGKNTAMKAENSYIKGGNDSLVWLEELIELEA